MTKILLCLCAIQLSLCMVCRASVFSSAIESGKFRKLRIVASVSALNNSRGYDFFQHIERWNGLDNSVIVSGVANNSEIYSVGSIATKSREEQSNPWAIVVGLTLLTVLPGLLIAMTPLVRLLVVFHFLRQALGTQTAPSNQVLMGLALVMTWFLIQPVLLKIDQTALTPYKSGAITGDMAIRLGVLPIKQYMLHYAKQKDLELFASAAMTLRPKVPEDLPMVVIVPSYILSELKAGFEIGALLFLPFILVDLAVASITTSIGMMQLPPVIISTPLKILLFVMVDGWNFLADQLLKSFR